jgi:hypothetical protein
MADARINITLEVVELLQVEEKCSITKSQGGNEHPN